MKTRNSKLKPCTGFTLLEVVVAMSIVGLGVVTLFEIFSLGLRLGAKSSERTQAVAYSRQAIDEFLTRRTVNEGVSERSIGDRYHWKIEIAPFQEGKQLSPTGWELKEITLKMRFQERESEKEVEMKTLRLVKTRGL